MDMDHKGPQVKLAPPPETCNQHCGVLNSILQIRQIHHRGEPLRGGNSGIPCEGGEIKEDGWQRGGRAKENQESGCMRVNLV